MAATHAFGPAGGAIMGVTLAVLLVSTVSAMVMAGPRVLHVIGEDYPFFRRLSHTNRDGIPAVAILTQAGLTLAFIFTASFRDDSGLRGLHAGVEQPADRGGGLRATVARAGGRTPLPCVGVSLHAPRLPGLTLSLTHIAMDRPAEALMAIPLIGAGLVFYVIAARGRRMERG